MFAPSRPLRRHPRTVAYRTRSTAVLFAITRISDVSGRGGADPFPADVDGRPPSVGASLVSRSPLPSGQSVAKARRTYLPFVTRRSTSAGCRTASGGTRSRWSPCGSGCGAWASRPSLPDARSDLLDCAVDVTRCRQGASHGSTTSQPRRCSSPASCSAGSRRRSCSALDSRSSVPAGGSAMASDVACSRSISSSASARVNLPAAWRCVNRIGPRASRKLSWPAACSSSSSSST